MVQDDRQTLLLDPCSNTVSLLDEGLAASVPILDVFPIEAGIVIWGI